MNPRLLPSCRPVGNPLFASLAAALFALAAGALPAPAVRAAEAKAPGANAAKPAAGPVLPRLSAEQLVEKNIAARGGAVAWRAVQSISFTGNLDAGRARPDNGVNLASKERLLDKPGKSAKLAQPAEQKYAKPDEGVPVTLPYTLVMARPHKQRMEIKFQDETLVQVFDGKNGWKLQPYLNRGGAQPFSAEELKKAEQFQEIDGPLVDYAAKGTVIAADGTDMVDGKAAYRLKLTLRNGAVRHVWIDAQSFLDVQVDGLRRFNGREVAQYTAQRDFRSIDGVKVPYLMETRVDGLPDRETIVVDKVALNPKVDDGLFSKPN